MLQRKLNTAIPQPRRKLQSSAQQAQSQAGADVEKESALVAVEPEELYCPTTNEAKSLAVVITPIAVEAIPLAVV